MLKESSNNIYKILEIVLRQHDLIYIVAGQSFTCQSNNEIRGYTVYQKPQVVTLRNFQHFHSRPFNVYKMDDGAFVIRPDFSFI